MPNHSPKLDPMRMKTELNDRLNNSIFFSRDIRDELCERMTGCLQTLLETKMLYQNSSVLISKDENGAAWRESIGRFAMSDMTFSTINDYAKMERNSMSCLVFVPETICTDCETCKGEITPHNPVQVSSAGSSYADTGDQTFTLSYKCQKCKKGLLVFLVRRKGLKLQLVGRNQVSSPSIPSSFPKEQEVFFKDAEMAYRTGSHLASICLLRVALEQYLRSETGQSSACSGDQLWELYKQRLPKDFPLDRVCNLGEIYGRLSKVMHCPVSLQDKTFPECKEELDHFFQFVRLFSLVGAPKPEKKTDSV